METERQREITKKRVNGFLDACVTNQIAVERTIFLVRIKGPTHNYFSYDVQIWMLAPSDPHTQNQKEASG